MKGRYRIDGFMDSATRAARVARLEELGGELCDLLQRTIGTETLEANLLAYSMEDESRIIRAVTAIMANASVSLSNLLFARDAAPEVRAMNKARG